MLSLDDLDHFDDRGMALQAGASAPRTDAETLRRLARIVACLNFCRDIPDEELVEGGLHAARRTLRSVLRSGKRRRPLPQDAVTTALEGALLVLGEQAARRGEPGHAVSERHAIEAEIQNVAGKLAGKDTVDPRLMASLARGEFELLRSSDFAVLLRAAGKFAAPVEVDLAIDGDGPADLVRVHLKIESGLWRWTAGEECCMSRNGDPALPLPPDDGVVQALLSGLALRSGCAIAAWAETAGEH